MDANFNFIQYEDPEPESLLQLLTEQNKQGNQAKSN